MVTLVRRLSKLETPSPNKRAAFNNSYREVFTDEDPLENADIPIPKMNSEINK